MEWVPSESNVRSRPSFSVTLPWSSRQAAARGHVVWACTDASLASARFQFLNNDFGVASCLGDGSVPTYCQMCLGGQNKWMRTTGLEGLTLWRV